MSPDDWQSIGQYGVLLILGGITAYKSWKADKQTKATGNGFAKHVKEALERIEAKGDETHRLMTEHLADHAGSDLSRR